MLWWGGRVDGIGTLSTQSAADCISRGGLVTPEHRDSFHCHEKCDSTWGFCMNDQGVVWVTVRRPQEAHAKKLCGRAVEWFVSPNWRLVVAMSSNTLVLFRMESQYSGPASLPSLGQEYLSPRHTRTTDTNLNANWLLPFQTCSSVRMSLTYAENVTTRVDTKDNSVEK